MSPSRSTQSATRGAADGGGAAGSDGRGGGGRRRGGGGRTPRVWFVAAGLVAVALLAVVAWQVVGLPGGGGAERLPVTVDAFSSTSVTEVLPDREVDSRDLAESELFERGAEELSSQGITFTLEEGELVEDCAAQVWGDRPRQALGAVDCTQAARAVYLAEEHIGQVTLFNLADTDQAQTLAEALQPEEEEGDGFVVPPEEGPAASLGAGYSAAELIVMGHYLMVLWTQEQGSEDPEERTTLAQPLRTLSNFDLAMFRRMGEHDHVEEGAGEETAEGEQGGEAGDEEAVPESEEGEEGGETGGEAGEEG